MRKLQPTKIVSRNRFVASTIRNSFRWKWKRVWLLAFLIPVSMMVSGQQTQRLNNNWQFLRQDLGGIWEAVRPVKAGDPESVPLWTNVSLPHCVNASDAVDPDVNYYQGPAWYKTQLSLQNPYADGRTLLHFEGAGQKTEVYVYTTKVATHVGGYDEFTVDITDAVEAFKKTDVFQKQFKNNVPLSIRTDNSRDLELIPSNLSDFNIYGGIYRYLNLVYVPALSIEKVFASAEVDKDGKAGKLQVSGRFHHPVKQNYASVAVRLLDPSGKLIKEIKKDVTNFDGNISLAVFEVKAPRLWSTEKPVLYTVETIVSNEAGTHKETSKIGFRHVEFIKKGPFHLNGKRLLLRGTHRHEDHAGVAAAMTEEMIREEMIAMKAMGVNFIRLGHYQQSRIILNLCDSLGILVWEEIPWCRGGLGGDVYKEQARRMLTNMIEQHYNHPSVFIWGLGNENDWPGDFSAFDKSAIREFMKELNDLSHKLDPGRKTAIRRCEFCKDIVDVYSPTIWAGWYRGKYTDYKAFSKTALENVDHFLHVEWGGDSHAGRHSESEEKALQQPGNIAAAKGGKDGDWSESYICNLVDWHLKEQETMPWLTGTAQWPFKDFSTPVRPDNPVPYMNQKGVAERDGTKKESYYVFQSYWTEQPMAHIYGHSWPVRWGDAGEEKMIKVYSNCDAAELFVNGQSRGIKKRNSQDFPAAGLRWNVVLQKGINQVKVVATKGKITVLDTISCQYQTEKWGKPSKVQLTKLWEENGIVSIMARLVDENGVACLDASNWMRFGVTGDGFLIDKLGTSTGSGKLQAYNGRGIIKLHTNKGKNVATVQVEGLPTAFLQL